MKRFILPILLIGMVFSLNGQDAIKKMKKAGKQLNAYNLDNTANASKLGEAQLLIDEALNNEEVKATAKAWLIQGKIYNEIANSEINARFVDPESKLSTPKAASIAMNALTKALSLAEKKFEKKEALGAMLENESHLNNTALTMFQDKNYLDAFTNFKNALDMAEVVNGAGGKSRLNEVALKEDHVFYTAVSAYYGGNTEAALPFLEMCLGTSKEEPFIFEALYNTYAESDKDKAAGFLNQGREKFPDDTGLLYAETNYMVAEGRLEDLIGKLELAIEKEPKNVSIYTTLGSVFDNLYQKEKEAGNMDKSDGYFAKSLEWFEKASEIDPKSFEAQYSIGALYYNKGAALTDALNEFANDFSAAGTKKYEALKAEMDGLFDTSFPYFEQAEALNPKDINTILAIKEIYARKGDFEKSNEYKEKLEALGGE